MSRTVAVSVRGSHGRISGEKFNAIARRLTAGDPVARRALQRGRLGRAFPRTDVVPLRDLIGLRLHPDANERALYKPIREHLEAQGWRPLPADVKAAIKNLRGPLAFDPEGDYGLRPDILLARPRAKRILVIEVKRYAAPTQGYRNPVDQVLDECGAIRKALQGTGTEGWKVEPLLVAEHFSRRVLAEASKARSPSGIAAISCQRWDGRKLHQP